MKTHHIFSLAFLIGCCSASAQTTNAQANTNTQPLLITKQATALKEFSRELSFADAPSLKGVSFKMSEAELLDILHLQKLKYERDVIADQNFYTIEPTTNEIVHIAFRDGHCSGIGIQRRTIAGYD
jgi:hypothetical protein